MKEFLMAKPNYAFAKRQRDLAKKAKQEEKRQKKLAAHPKEPEGSPTAPPSGTLPTA